MSAGEETLAFQLKALKIPFEQQVRPSEDRKWTCDFYLSFPVQIYVEVEGGAHSGGHKRGAAADTDCEKFNWMTLQGLRVLRFTTAMVTDGRALQTIEEALERC